MQDQKKNEQVVKYKETHLWERSPEERAGSTYSFSSPNFRLHIILSWAGSNMMSSPWMLLKRPFFFTENLIAPTWLDSYLKRSFLRHRLSGTDCTQASSCAPPPSFYSHPHTSGAQQTSSTLARFLSFEVGGVVVEVTLQVKKVHIYESVRSLLLNQLQLSPLSPHWEPERAWIGSQFSSRGKRREGRNSICKAFLPGAFNLMSCNNVMFT